jgi:hypothetical protein
MRKLDEKARNKGRLPKSVAKLNFCSFSAAIGPTDFPDSLSYLHNNAHALNLPWS